MFFRRSRPAPPPITEAQRAATFSRRAVFVRGAQMSVGALIAVRMGYISIVENQRYTLLSESNRINLTLVPPRRGWIVDRAGKALADNRVALRVDVIPDRLVNAEATLAQLATLLRLTPDDLDRIRRDIERAGGMTPVQVADNVAEADFAAVSVRLPELPGVAPARAFTRNYPTGAAVAHLIGYVGAPSAEEYKQARDPLYVTPGFKTGKDGIEKSLNTMLTGKPGAKRVEVTARGKVVRDLGGTDDTPGRTVQLTIDAGLQDYAARRMGLESGAAVVLDCLTGATLAYVSMPAFDPNSFSDGIGRLEWKMLQEDDHIPLLNKAVRALYPPGSTVKPIAGIAIQEAGVDPAQRVFCPGGYRLGNRFYQCLGRHGLVDLPTAIEKSCNTYFYAMAHRLGYDPVAAVAKRLGLGQEFPLIGTAQRYGTVPDSAWKKKKYGTDWTASDSLNAIIGQGYLIVNPLQLAVSTARIASGRMLMPTLTGEPKPGEPLPFAPEHLAVVSEGMRRVVNGNGTAVRSRLPLDGIQLAGKTGTAQVRGLKGGRGGLAVARKYRDHGLFICFAPADNPRYAAAVAIEHGMGGSRAAAPVAKDIFTYLFDPEKATATLETLEAGWGGTVQERMARRYAAYQAAAGAPPVSDLTVAATPAAADAPATTPTPEPSAAPAAPTASQPAPGPAPTPPPAATPAPPVDSLPTATPSPTTGPTP